MNLNNKVAIITWWTKWIWEAISLDFAERWIKVCVIYYWDENNANKFQEKIKKINSDYLVLKADVSKIEDTNYIYEKVVEKFWWVDILVNNAGTFLSKENEANIEKRYKKLFEINFFSSVYMTEKFGELFKWDLWKIINISSIAWVNPFSYTWWVRSPEYCCSKASMDLYTKLMARTYDWKILVNGIAPWSTNTPLWDWVDENFKKIRASESMINRYMEPKEISKTAVFLLENDAINWDIIVVDGGNILN